MTDLLDLLSEADGGTGRADHTPVVHIITPDFATLCRLDYLEGVALGDRLAISVRRWRDLTCPWCRSLGRGYHRHACAVMQARQAA